MQWKNGNGPMKNYTQDTSEPIITSSVIALHCSLGSGYQWARLAEQLANKHQVITPDISGYGNNAGPFEPPTTLAKEVDLMSDRLGEAVEVNLHARQQVQRPGSIQAARHGADHPVQQCGGMR